MATLILTTVGTAIGGPIGGALGALAGRALDGQVFRPGARQGPRLTELTVQTSSYGTQIPRLFGTIRVAGTVIWSTDLIESRATEGGGKGAPDMVRYSYSVSFAVLLSARAIRGVRRIWADGKLLRGAAGDFKSRTGFRLYTGREDQAPDPLIASAVGIARATAMRGQAYAVFEGMALADYGNRIPSLTFEVEADEAGVDAGAIANELGGIRAEGPLSPRFDGYSAYGDSTRAVLEGLAAATGSWFADGEMRAGTGAALTVADEGVAAPGARGPRRSRAMAAADQVPKVVTLGHYDAMRDYQAGLQRASRPGAGLRERHEALPAVLPAATAKQVAAQMLARAEGERLRRRVSLGWEALAIAPGDRVRVEGDATLWRVAGWQLEGMAVELELAPIAVATASAAASTGEAVRAPDRRHGRTLLVAAELAPLDGLADTPQVAVMAGGSEPGWRGATLMASRDGVGWEAVASLRAPGVVGTVAVPPGAGLSAIEDRANAIVVEFANPGMTLSGASVAMMDGGANLALVGEELIQFAMAEMLSPTRWRLSGLWRGRRGTERAMVAHVAGERFALLTPDSVTWLPARVVIGGTLRLAASGIGDPDALEPIEVAIDGRSVAPPAPVHVRRDGDLVRWVRRSRAGWRWVDGIDAPLAEEREAYRVTMADGSVQVTERTEWRGAAASIAQLGTHAASPPTAISFEENRHAG